MFFLPCSHKSSSCCGFATVHLGHTHSPCTHCGILSHNELWLKSCLVPKQTVQFISMTLVSLQMLATLLSWCEQVIIYSFSSQPIDLTDISSHFLHSVGKTKSKAKGLFMVIQRLLNTLNNVCLYWNISDVISEPGASFHFLIIPVRSYPIVYNADVTGGHCYH